MNYRDIIVFDFETGSRNPHKTQPTQIAAIALHGRRLTLQPGGVFNSEIRPILDDKKAGKVFKEEYETVKRVSTSYGKSFLSKYNKSNQFF